MTHEQARAALKRPLMFGDQEQIDAAAFLQQVQVANQRIARCKRCGGTGKSKRGYPCRGCAVNYPYDVLRALAITTKPWPGQEEQAKLV